MYIVHRAASVILEQHQLGSVMFSTSGFPNS